MELTRIEKYLAAIKNGSGEIPDPILRIEYYLYALATGQREGIPEPITRTEKLFYEIATDTDLSNPADLIEKLLIAVIRSEEAAEQAAKSAEEVNAALQSIKDGSYSGEFLFASDEEAQDVINGIFGAKP